MIVKGNKAPITLSPEYTNLALMNTTKHIHQHSRKSSRLKQFLIPLFRTGRISEDPEVDSSLWIRETGTGSHGATLRVSVALGSGIRSCCFICLLFGFWNRHQVLLYVLFVFCCCVRYSYRIFVIVISVFVVDSGDWHRVTRCHAEGQCGTGNRYQILLCVLSIFHC